MKSQISNNIFFSLFDTLLSTILVFILYKVVINSIGMEMVGAWALVLAATSITRMNEFGLSDGVTKFVAKYLAIGDREKAAKVVTTATFSIICIVGLSYVVVYPILQIIIVQFVGKDIAPIVRELLPYAMVSFYINTIGSSFQSGLDGCNRIDINRKITICCNIIYFMVSIFLVKSYGIIGLAYSQLTQSLCIACLCGFCLKKEMAELSFSPRNWSKIIFKEIFLYGVKFQMISILVIFSDPIVKFLLSKYGGISSVGYYEIVGKIVLRVRALIVSVNQVMVPLYAKFTELNQAMVVKTYNINLRCMLFAGVIIFPWLLLIAPSLSMYFFSINDPIFIEYFTLITIAHFLNIIAMPAYFANLGIGRLGPNLYSHLFSSVSCVIMGVILGPALGDSGIVLSYLLSTCLGSIILVYLFHKLNKLPVSGLFKIEDILVLTTSAMALILTRCVSNINHFNLTWYWIEIIKILLFVSIVAIPILRHKLSQQCYSAVKLKLCHRAHH